MVAHFPFAIVDCLKSGVDDLDRSSAHSLRDIDTRAAHRWHRSTPSYISSPGGGISCGCCAFNRLDVFRLF